MGALASVEVSAPASRRAQVRFMQRVVTDPALAQVWFSTEVLDVYRRQIGMSIVRTDTVGRLRCGAWRMDFGIGAGPDGELLHVSARDLAERLPASDHAHWISFAVKLPTSTNFLLMQSTRGACIDDGDLRSW